MSDEWKLTPVDPEVARAWPGTAPYMTRGREHVEFQPEVTGDPRPHMNQREALVVQTSTRGCYDCSGEDVEVCIEMPDLIRLLSAAGYDVVKRRA